MCEYGSPSGEVPNAAASRRDPTSSKSALEDAAREAKKRVAQIKNASLSELFVGFVVPTL
jgi:hypothetical protein